MVFGVRQVICECNTSSRRLMRSKKNLKDLYVVCFFLPIFFTHIYTYIYMESGTMSYIEYSQEKDRVPGTQMAFRIPPSHSPLTGGCQEATQD